MASKVNLPTEEEKLAKIRQTVAERETTPTQPAAPSSTLKSSTATGSSAVSTEEKKSAPTSTAKTATQTATETAEEAAPETKAPEKTTKELAEEAEKTYKDYLESDEYKQKQTERMQKLAQEQTMNQLLTGIAPGSYQPQLEPDAKEEELKAAADYYKNKAQEEEDEAVMVTDLEELASWSEEDQRALRLYVANRDIDFYNVVNNGQNGAITGNAEQQAAALFEKFGKERVDEIAESFRRNQNAKMTEDVKAAAQESAGKGFWAGLGHSAATVPVNLLGGSAAILDYMRELGERSGRYSTLDPNARGNIGNVYSGAVRETVAQNIEGENGENGVVGKIGSLLYQGGMSALDSGTRALTGSAGNMILSGMNSFSQTMAEASSKGATPGQAAALAATNAAIEAVSEKLPLDNLLDAAKGGKQTATQIIVNALKQAGIEATTEELSLIGTTLAEAAILREKSGYNQQIQQGLAEGKTYAEAKADATTALLVEAANTAAVSAISGGISSGGASMFANIANRGVAPETTQQAQTEQPGVEAPQNGQVPTQIESPAQAPAAAENETNVLNDVVGKYQKDGAVTNKMAEAILSDPAAVQQLQQQTGVQITGTKSEMRNAVKLAVRDIAGGTVQMTQEGGASLIEDLTAEGFGQQQEAHLQSKAAAQQDSTPQVDTLVTPDMASPIPQGRSTTSGLEAGINGTGAAEANFSGKPAYNATLSAANAQSDRRNDVRSTELPANDINDNPVSATTANVYGSQNTPDDLASAMEEPVARGDFSYVRISNDTATQKAQQTIESAGSWESARDNFRMDVDRGNAGAELSARGALILNHAAEVYQQAKDSGDAQAAARAKQEWLTILSDVQKLGTNTAQGLQALKIIRNLMPQDKMQFARIAVQNMVRDMKIRSKVQIDESLIAEYENATTDQQRDEIMEKIQQNVADQIPSTMLDKWNALRYTNMLGNLKTTVRNIGGNVGNSLAYRIKDSTAALIETIANKVSGGKVGRTKSVIVNRGLQKACGSYFAQVKNAVSSGGKYGENNTASTDFGQSVMDKRRIFKSDFENDTVRKVADMMLAPMEGYRKATNWMMNNQYFGDEAFGKTAFTHAMAGYLQANGIKTDAELQNADPTLIEKAMAYAVKEAQETTFHDNSALSRILGKVKNNTGVIGEGIMPFTKTPANVLMRAEEMSPLGIINTAVTAVRAANPNSDVTGTDVINSLAKTLTGTAIFALGAAMKSQGLLNGGPDDDEEKAAFDKENGIQDYSINLPDGTTYTLDWLTPEAMPLFMGAEFMDIASDKDLTFADLERIFTSIADPMIQMSMMQGINRSLDSIKYSDNNMGQFFMNAAVSYLTQGLTNTLLGQIERSTEDYRQTTYVDKDSDIPVWVQQQLGSASQKILGWDYQQTDYRDSFGQKQKNEGGLLYNLASPGYAAKKDIDAVDKELYRLHDAGVEDVFPERAATKVTYTSANGEKKAVQLTAEQYQTYAATKGDNEKRILNDVMRSDVYKAMTDDQKNNVRKIVEAYAKDKGMQELFQEDYDGSENWMKDLNSDNDVSAILNKAVTGAFTSALDDLADDLRRGNDTAQSMEAMEQAYTNYEAMSYQDRVKYLESGEASGRVKYYIQARNLGVSTATFSNLYRQYSNIENMDKDISGKAQEWAYQLEKAVDKGIITERQKDTLKSSMQFRYSFAAETTKFDEMIEAGVNTDKADRIVHLLDGITGTGSNGTVRDIDKRQAIATAPGLSTSEIDTVMKAYMADYDPNDSSPEKTELKYDYIRQELGLSAKAYAETYRAHLDNSKKAEKIAAIMDLGYDRKTATALYKVYQGQTDVVKWYNNHK